MKESFNSCIQDIIKNTKFNKLKCELHHGITRYDHSYRVAKWTHIIGTIFHMKNIENTTRAALLHDFYINEDLIGNNSVKKLGLHPEIALKNSLNYYRLDNIQQDIIKSHMFPCNLTVPKYKESWLVSSVDKIVGAYEMLRFKTSLYAGISFLFLFELLKISR